MHLEMQRYENPSHLKHDRWDLALVGTTVDDRSEASIGYARSNAEITITLQYEAIIPRLLADSQPLECDDLTDHLRSLDRTSILLDAASLGVAEIALCCRAFRTINPASFSILYVEPGEYNAPNVRDPVHRRVYDLSEETPNYIGIPGLTFILEDESPDQTVVFLLGYEGERLERAFDQLNLNSKNCSVIFGVPGFRAGWETSSFENNIRFLNEQNIKGGVFFKAADNPLAVLEFLEEMYQGRGDGPFFVAPIGTKPHAIGAALFAGWRDDVGLLYDHPKPRNRRSNRLGTWHIFDIHPGSSA
jgi:hypothetical protein